MSINNIYMFKNPVRHFLDISTLEYNKNLSLDNLAWTRPIDFVIKKSYDTNDIRILKLPNILNFVNLYEKMKQLEHFDDIKKNISVHSKMDANLTTGDFSAFSFKKSLEMDLLKLTEFDVLLVLDIKSFYDSIYTHYLDKIKGFNVNSRFITNCNMGISKGILMGSYISLFIAEKLLSLIADKFTERLKSKEIEHHINFFSDDFYIFTDNKNIDEVKQTFSLVLSEFDLVSNNEKFKRYNYTEYTNLNIIDKYWNTIFHLQRNHIERVNRHSNRLSSSKKQKEPLKYCLNFLNQLLYRRGLLEDAKLQAILINGFFKSNFFINLDINQYEFRKTDLHKILYLCKEHPEIILYVVPKFIKFENFSEIAKENFQKQFLKSLQNPFQEIQLYYFRGVSFLNFDYLFEQNTINKVFATQNQILKSYYVLYIKKKELLESLLVKNENHWFLNYHIILSLAKTDTDIEKLILDYLIPDEAKDSTKKSKEYFEFYHNNIINNKILFNLNMDNTIEEYLKNKVKERDQNSPALHN